MQGPRSLSIYQSIMNKGFNARFFLMGLFDGFNWSTIAGPGDIISILGEQVQIDQSNVDKQNDLLYRLFSRIPWLTYRTGFPQLYHDLKGTYVNDTGWGCMIRVGQMAWAQIIRRHRKVASEDQMGEVINLFNDFDGNQPFSIQKISKFARRQYGILPGDWYNPSQISHILSSLNQTSIQAKQKLSFLVFNSGNLFYDQIIEVMLDGRQPVRCQCPPISNKIICTKCNRSELSLGLVILGRIGLNSPEDKYLPVLSNMMKIGSFAGVVGGRPGKALYLIGTHGKEYFVYLDPHYVQDAKKNVQQIKQSYFCNSFRVCNVKSIDPSFGICFYFRDFDDLNKFYEQMINCKRQHQEGFFIWASQTTPSYLSKSIRISKEIEIEEDVYQPL